MSINTPSKYKNIPESEANIDNGNTAETQKSKSLHNLREFFNKNYLRIVAAITFGLPGAGGAKCIDAGGRQEHTLQPCSDNPNHACFPKDAVGSKDIATADAIGSKDTASGDTASKDAETAELLQEYPTNLKITVEDGIIKGVALSHEDYLKKGEQGRQRMSTGAVDGKPDVFGIDFSDGQPSGPFALALAVKGEKGNPEKIEFAVDQGIFDIYQVVTGENQVIPETSKFLKQMVIQAIKNPQSLPGESVTMLKGITGPFTTEVNDGEKTFVIVINFPKKSEKADK